MATQGVQMKFWGVQNATFDENPHENERIRVILGYAISSIATKWMSLKQYVVSDNPKLFITMIANFCDTIENTTVSVMSHH